MGYLKLSEVLKASYDYEDDENDLEAMTLFQWYRADDSTGSNETLIIGATDSLYTLDINDENLFVRVKITPIAESGANPGLLAESNYFGPINAAPPSNVMNPITGKVWLDKNLGASRVVLDKTDADSYGALSNGDEQQMVMKIVIQELLHNYLIQIIRDIVTLLFKTHILGIGGQLLASRGRVSME